LLNRSYRFGQESGIGTLARLVNQGRGGEALALLKDGAHQDIAWRTITASDIRSSFASTAVDRLRCYFESVRSNNDPQKIFDIFNQFRVLCAHRRGLSGVIALNRMIEGVLEDEHLVASHETWYAGRPVMITRNDYNLRLFNGDVGITLPDPHAPGHVKVFFPGADEGLRAFAPSRVPEHETVYAMTIHKSQGSQFGAAAIVLPPPDSRILSRELLYTAVTRAQRTLVLAGSEASIRAAVARPVARASGLGERLWGRGQS
jgi:exodeoxyribonuclease V alpha subunit